MLLLCYVVALEIKFLAARHIIKYAHATTQHTLLTLSNSDALTANIRSKHAHAKFTYAAHSVLASHATRAALSTHRKRAESMQVSSRLSRNMKSHSCSMEFREGMFLNLIMIKY